MENENNKVLDSGREGSADREIAAKLLAAYDAMDPTPEQEQRMLASLLSAAGQGAEDAAVTAAAAGAGSISGDSGTPADGAEADSEAGHVPGAGGEGGESAAKTCGGPYEAGKQSGSPAPVPSPNRVRKVKPWKVALPLAACLVVGAVIVGVASQPAPTESLHASTGTIADRLEGVSNAASATTEAKSVDESEQYDAVDGLAAGSADMAVMSGANVPSDDDVADIARDFNTEEYDALKERGFVSTKASPLSTVSADVDTASYCNVRRMVNDGYALSDIPSGAVRIEEMLNYFDYGYPTVTCGTGGDKFGMQAQSAPCPWNEDTQLLVLGFAAAPEAKAAGKGSNLVFLVDVSGSMDSADKLDLLQNSFATLLESLGPHDRVSIVTYASGEEVVLEGASGNDDKEILRTIYKLHAEGSTNGEAGLAQAYEVAERNFIEGGVNRIIMASDGDLNVGMTSESDLYDFVDGKRQSGIYLSVLGFGSGNYKDNKMETLADHGNGSYHYIDCIEEAERVLRDKLTANLVPFADDVKVQVEFNPAQVKAYRLIGYENRALADEDFRDDAVDAGDVGPGVQFTVAYEVVLASSKMDVAEPELKYGAGSAAGSEAVGSGFDGASADWLTCTLRYHDFDADDVREQQLPVDAGNVMAQPSDDWRMAAAVIEFGMLARNSAYAGTSSADSILELLGTGLSDERDAFKRLVVKAF